MISGTMASDRQLSTTVGSQLYNVIKFEFGKSDGKCRNGVHLWWEVSI